MDIRQGQGLSVLLDAFWNEGDIRLRQVRIASAGRESLGLGGVAIHGHLDRRVIQLQGPGVAVLRGDLQLRAQLLQDGFHIVGAAGLGDRLNVRLGVHAHLIFPSHVQ